MDLDMVHAYCILTYYVRNMKIKVFTLMVRLKFISQNCRLKSRKNLAHCEIISDANITHNIGIHFHLYWHLYDRKSNFSFLLSVRFHHLQWQCDVIVWNMKLVCSTSVAFVFRSEFNSEFAVKMLRVHFYRRQYSHQKSILIDIDSLPMCELH